MAYRYKRSREGVSQRPPDRAAELIAKKPVGYTPPVRTSAPVQMARTAMKAPAKMGVGKVSVDDIRNFLRGGR